MTGLDADTAAFVAAHRHTLNQRLLALRQRYPRAATAPLWQGLAAELPGLRAAVAAQVSGDRQIPLLLALFDLVALHALRGTLARPAIARLIDEVLCAPAVLRLAAAAPSRLPAALSNAAERLDALALPWLQAMTVAAASAGDSEALLDAGAVCAWRLGDTRMRAAAMAVVTRLPPPLLVPALGLPAWAAPVAPVVAAALRRDGWLRPLEVIGPRTTALLQAGAAVTLPGDLDALGRRDEHAPLEAWVEAGRIGAFVGLGGRFVAPPRVVAVGGPHLLYVGDGSDVWALQGDAFGAVAQPMPLDLVPGLGEAAAPALAAPAGLAQRAQALAQATAALGTTSMVAGPGVVAWTSALSYRVRVLVPPLRPEGALP